MIYLVEDNRKFTCIRTHTQFLQYGNPILFRQHHIQEQKCRFFLFQGFPEVRRSFKSFCFKSLTFQCINHQFTYTLIIFYQIYHFFVLHLQLFAECHKPKPVYNLRKQHDVFENHYNFSGSVDISIIKSRKIFVLLYVKTL